MSNKTPSKANPPNSLISETSPYLLQHAYNPVKWHPWNEKSLQLAHDLQKPILVSIGYSACHWCHVMEHESFEDKSVAEAMNNNFICIKVDREERPDVDQLYMNAAQLITGGGGWPLNCFAFPDGRPFYAGTYFQKEKWLQLLERINSEWSNNRKELNDYATKLLRGIKQSSTITKVDGFLSNTQNILDLIDQSVVKWSASFDHENGGANRAPKFPLPNNYQFLLRWAFETENKPVLDYVHFTLEKMARGGIYDQIGGGFSRYAVDNKWKVPHFEKMLYDNAQLLSLYSQAHLQKPSAEYEDLIHQTANFLTEELRHSSNLFYSAYDADSEGVEGKYYVWTAKEFDALFESESTLAKSYFGINARGYWEHENFILCRTDDQSILDEFSLTQSELTQKVQWFTEVLVKERAKRVMPGLDDKCLTSWNALAISGFASAYNATKQRSYKVQAEQSLHALLEHQLKPDGSLVHSFKNGVSTIQGFLEDYAAVIQALLDVFEMTYDTSFAYKAKELMEYSINHFYQENTMMFEFTSHQSKDLVAKQTDYFDNVIPASNSIMCRNLFRLSHLFLDVKYRSIGLEMIDLIAPRVVQYGSGFSNWMIAMLEAFGNYKEVVIVGEKAIEYAEEIKRAYSPSVSVIANTSGASLPVFEGRFKDNKTLVYICQHNTCQEPVETVAEAIKMLT